MDRLTNVETEWPALVVPKSQPETNAAYTMAVALGRVDAAHRRLRTRLAHRLGLHLTDLIALVIISGVDDCTAKKLAAELGLSPATVTAVIDRLAASGHAQRTPKTGDRRSILVELTVEGNSIIQKISTEYLGALTIALKASSSALDQHVFDLLQLAADAIDSSVQSPQGIVRV